MLEYIFDDLERPERAAIESHFDGCPRCRRQALAWRRLQRLLPEPSGTAPDLPDAVRDRVWSGVTDEISVPEASSPFRSRSPWRAAARWTAVAAAVCLAFLFGRSWEDLSQAALRAAGMEPSRAGGYFSGLDSFERSSDSYLQRTRLLLMEVHLGGGSTQQLADPWLARHSLGLLSEAPRHLASARRLRNPHLEALLRDLEAVLREVLESDAGAALPEDLESDLETLLMKLEILERPAPAPVPPPIAS
jgi:anti-sigma factor RsiW